VACPSAARFLQVDPQPTLFPAITGADGDALDAYVARIHPDDVEHVVALVDLADVNDAHVIVRVRDGVGTGWRLVEHRARRSDDGLVLECLDVTAREQDRLRVSRTEAYWRMILRNGHEAIVVIDPSTHRVRHASEHLETLMGEITDGLVGRSVASLLHPEDRSGLTRAIDRLDGHNGRVEVELRLTPFGREPRWVEAVFSDARADEDVAAIVVNMRDIEDRKRAEHQLRSSERLFRVLLDHLADGALVVDSDRIVRFSSERFAEAMGTTVDRLVGQPYPLRIDPGNGAVRLDTDHTLDIPTWGELPDEIVGARGRWYELTIHDPSRDPVVNGQIMVFRDVTKGRRHLEQLRHELEVDGLTGLLNRRGLERQVAEWERAGETTQLAFLDLNGFKEVNDTYGHAVGDILLQQVASRLRGLTRPSDLVARLGGDEFVVVTAPDRELSAEELVARFGGQLAGGYRVGVHTVNVGVSVGWSEVDQAMPFDDALRAADQLMYADKRRQQTSR